ncbi:MAG: type II toxin-antitoxin system VapC family toxin [Rhodanobacteraceae bacterium]|jgi:tRNA(fMet)-specific endonuclease VapC|nr:type II toxin-antitoxin system VapC family toxin [Rhodanobacteraceae bacterium]MBL0041928.1 type II toxin-antitoxin system VapC family toxin [Xanthomonadales bacterium]MBP6077814.1 type II toxin-antitoxin system VapC family toxin [Xanthomonadales bacterium]MBP7623217.1 type II toxin-antitoxin system VapC family toxin [Xanthomonadales bacterium]
MAAEYLLDSNILIAIINQTSRPLLNKLAGLAPQRMHLSAIVLSELLTGVAKGGPNALSRQATLKELIASMTPLYFDHDAADAYARIRAKLEAAGQTIGPMDLLISAQAISRNLILVTDNLREFRRVPGLACENWLR